MVVFSLVYRPVAESIIRGPLWYQSVMRWGIRQGLPTGVTLEDVPDAIVFNFPARGYTTTILSL